MLCNFLAVDDSLNLTSYIRYSHKHVTWRAAVAFMCKSSASQQSFRDSYSKISLNFMNCSAATCLCYILLYVRCSTAS